MNSFKNVSTPLHKVFAVMAIFAMVMSTFAFAPFVRTAEAAVSADLDQAENGGVNSAAITPVDWVNGNVNQSKGHYAEGDSIPYRVVAEGLTAGIPSTLIIGFDVTQSNKFAIDYITSNDRINETVNPCSDIPAVCSGVPNTAPIPAPGYSGSINGFGAADVLASFNALVVAEGQQVVKIWNGSISSVTYTTQANLTNAAAEARVTIVFTPTSDKAVISWGGHISESLDYPGESAVNIPGSPYHTRLISINGGGGNQDRSLSASAVEYPGNLIVIKHVVNDGGGTKTANDFTINVTASNTVTPSQFSGSEDGTGVTINVPKNGTTTYTVTEVEDPNYTATYEGDCTNAGIATLQQKVCTITNTYVPPAATLTLVKSVSGGLAAPSEWTLSATGPDTISGPGGVGPIVVEPGTYTLSESTGPSRYTASAWDCGIDKTVTNNQVELVNGDNVTCTITNTYLPPDQASITVVKTVINDNGGTADESTFQYWVNGVTQIFHNVAAMFDALTPTLFTLTETNTDGYTPSTWTGGCALDGTVTLGEGEDATCYITNDDIAPQITITKVVHNGTSETPMSADDFNIVLTAADINGVEADDEKTFPGNENGTTFTFDAGSYAVTEPSYAGYTTELTGDCAGTAALAAELACTVTNTYIEPTVTTVKFTKVVDNQFGGTAVPSDFSLHIVGTNVDIDVTVPHGGSTQLPLGSYTVTETGPTTGYSADYAGFCEDAVMTVAQGDLGKARDCTVTNHGVQPELTVIKHVINDNDTENDVDLLADAFTLGVTGTDVSTSSFAGSETGVVVKLDAGAFNVTEEEEAGYLASFGDGCTGTIGLGEKKTCIVTNDDIPPTEAIITITKVLPLEPDYILPNGTPDDFSFIMDGYNGGEPVFFEADGTNVITVTTAGDHTVAEVAAPGYDTSYSLSCDDLSNVALGWSYSCTVTNVELPQCSDGIDNDDDGYIDYRGEDVGCTDGNDDSEKDPVGSITIDKEVIGEGASGDQIFSFGSWEPNAVFLSANSGTHTFSELAPGQYSISESNIPSRWDLVDVTCIDNDTQTEEIIPITEGDAITLNLSLGENLTCTFTNEYTPRDSGSNSETIIVRKEVTGGSSTSQVFTFDPSWSDTNIELIAGTQTESPDLNAEEAYSVFELVPDGWTLENVSCVSNRTQLKRLITLLDSAEPINPAQVTLQDGETVTCTFTNDEDYAVIEGYKFNDVDADGIWDEGENGLSGWTIEALVDAEGDDLLFSDVTDGTGFYSIKVPAGAVGSVHEVQQSGWTQTAPNSESQGVCFFEVGEYDGEGANAECIFGNHQNPPTTGGGGGGGNGRRVSLVQGDSTDDEGEVLGESIDVLPAGAPNTGMGGTASNTFGTLFALLGMLVSFATMRMTKHG